jgi:hypothetical protein
MNGLIKKRPSRTQVHRSQIGWSIAHWVSVRSESYLAISRCHSPSENGAQSYRLSGRLKFLALRSLKR